MIKETLTAAKEALKSIPSLRYTAEDWGQLDSFNQPPVRFPCVLLDVEEIRYSDNGRGSQQGEASLTVRVADNRAVNGSFQAPPSTSEFAMFDLLQAVYKALQGLSGPGFSPLTRRHTVRVRREDGIREFRTSFDFAFTDNDAAAKRR
jgi:hypothetical protein